MTTAIEHFQAGQLTEAVAAAIEQVRNKPADVATRWHLCSLFCFTGELERVDKHLDLIAQQEPNNAAGVALFRQLVRAELARQQFYAEGRLPEFLGQPTEALQQRLGASIRLREGKAAEAGALLAQAEEKRQPITGAHDGKPMADLRDLDDLTSSVFEVLTSTGKYYWAPIESVRILEFRKAQGPRDLYWRQARMAVANGPDGDVYLPALYPNSHLQTNNDLRLGRATEWIESETGPVRGIGQRMFLVGDDALGIGDLKTLEFANPVDLIAAKKPGPA